MKRIIVDCGIFQTRIALVDGKNLIEFIVEDNDEKSLVGNIYKGKIANVLPGMEAAFIDIGVGKNAYLHFKEVMKPKGLDNIRDVLKAGRDIIVQVVKDGTVGKGPKVTTKLSFPGKYMVLMLENNQIGISRRINDSVEIERLINLVEEFKPKKLGAIVRTEAVGKNSEDLKQDLKMLIDKYETIVDKSKRGISPRMLSDETTLVERTIRDILSDDIEEIIINDKSIAKQVKGNKILSEEYRDKVVYSDPGIDIMSFYGVNKLLNKSLSNKIWLKSGGFLVIQNTEAMTIIDVNSGKFTGSSSLKDTIVAVNTEAVREVAKQIRLRNISGIIIIDLIDMHSKALENKILKMFKEELSSDRVKSNVLGFTRLGLIEMTRKKSGKSLKEILYEDCGACQGRAEMDSLGSLINKLEKEIRRVKEHTSSEAVLVKIKSYYHNYDKAIKSAMDRLKDIYEIDIFYEIDSSEVDESSFFIMSMGRLKDVKDMYCKAD